MSDREKPGDDFEASEPISKANVPLGDERCPNCLTTWETLRREGRAGCAACYEAFRASLGGVMTRVQRGDFHLGKTPRAAQKRARRGENLVKRRENQLGLLQNRLKAAIASEKFEEAAALQAKIRELS
jgi:protein arginine kinase activator